MSKVRPKQIISVGGGKGGVGKSLIAANVAIALAQRGRRVILADLDLGMANQHTLFGIDKPGPTLHAFFQGEITQLADALVPTACANLRLLPGSGAHLGAANIHHSQKGKLIRHLHALDTDVLIIDVGAGMHYTTLDFYLAADVRLLVLTAQLTSLQNAYAFLKVALYRSFRNVAGDAKQRSLLDDEQMGELQRVHDMVVKMSAADPQYGAAVQRVRDGFGLQLVGNMMNTSQDLSVLHALGRMIRDFLGVNSQVLGHVRTSRRVHDSVTQRRPMLLGGTLDDNGALIQNMAGILAGVDSGPARQIVDEQHFDADGSPGTPTEGESLPANLARYRRRHERFDVKVPVFLLDRDQSLPAEFQQLSLSGALLVAPYALTPNQRIQILIPAPQANQELLIGCTVRNQRPDMQAYGIEFDDLQPDLLNRVAKTPAPPG